MNLLHLTHTTASRVAIGAIAVAAVVGISGCASQPKADQGAQTSSASSSSTSTSATKDQKARTLDLQAHRGGRGEYTEESIEGFGKALDLGVTTLEFDVVMSKDGVPVVWHDPIVLETKCQDTGPARPDDPQYPYVGKLVHDLTWDQLQTLRCDKKLEGFEHQHRVIGNKMAQLKDVFALTTARKADVFYNIETKVEAEHPDWSASPEEFVNAIMNEVDAAGVADKVSIQSFDWRTLPLVHQHNENIPLVVLWDDTTWKQYSLWIGDINYDEVDGDIIKAAKKLDADVLSPGYTVPYGLTPSDSNFKLVADKDFIDRAHKEGLKVIPWTVNDLSSMRAQIKAGADGIITDYPTKLRGAMKAEGMKLPKQYPEG